MPDVLVYDLIDLLINPVGDVQSNLGKYAIDQQQQEP